MGTRTPTGGSIFVDNIHISTFLVCLDGTNAIDQAAGMATKRPRNVDPSEMITELEKCLK